MDEAEKKYDDFNRHLYDNFDKLIESPKIALENAPPDGWDTGRRVEIQLRESLARNLELQREVEWIRQVSTGEIQVANDDTEALRLITERIDAMKEQGK